MPVIDYEDEDGVVRTVQVANAEDNPLEGLPVSIDLDGAFHHVPVQWRRELYAGLRARGLVKPSDFMRPGAVDDINAALRDVLRADAFDIMRVAREQESNG